MTDTERALTHRVEMLEAQLENAHQVVDALAAAIIDLGLTLASASDAIAARVAKLEEQRK